MKAIIRLKGGAGSGNHGHAGRPGKQGGSAKAKYDSYGNEVSSDASGKVTSVRNSGSGMPGGPGKLSPSVTGSASLKKAFPKVYGALHEMALDNDMGVLNSKFKLPKKFEDVLPDIEKAFAALDGHMASELPKNFFPKKYLTEDRGYAEDVDAYGDAEMLTTLTGGDEHWQNAVIKWLDNKGLAGTAANKLLEYAFNDAEDMWKGYD